MYSLRVLSQGTPLSIRERVEQVVGSERGVARLLASKDEVDPLVQVRRGVLGFERRAHGPHKLLGGAMCPWWQCDRPARRNALVVQ